MSNSERKICVGITGASGAIYAVRTVAALLGCGCHVELVASDLGRRLIREELGSNVSVENLFDFVCERYEISVSSKMLVVHNNKNVGASIASGSYLCDSMVIVPCSMKTLSGVAHGSSRNLIERAADVTLKEKRRLVLVPRETPMSLPQLRNLVVCAESGAMVLPAMPAFYQQPKNLDDLSDFMAGKILSDLGMEHELYPAWMG